jgi:hypothetical protein
MFKDNEVDLPAVVTPTTAQSESQGYPSRKPNDGTQTNQCQSLDKRREQEINVKKASKKKTHLRDLVKEYRTCADGSQGEGDVPRQPKRGHENVTEGHAFSPCPTCARGS